MNLLAPSLGGSTAQATVAARAASGVERGEDQAAKAVPAAGRVAAVSSAADLSRRGAVRAGLLAAANTFALLMTSCGYHVAGKTNTIPDEVHSIAIPPFQNATTEYKIEQFLRAAVVDEFITRTRYHIVSDGEDADATLSATVLLFRDFPATYDPKTNRASTVQTETHVHVALWDRKGGRPVYENPRMVLTEMYEVSIDPKAYFEERQAAIERTSRSAAREMVSAILSGF